MLLKIRPALERGAVVVCDRFVDSSIAYQSFKEETLVTRFQKVNRYATGGLEPDVTFFMDLDPSSRARIGKDVRDRLEQRSWIPIVCMMAIRRF